MIEVVFPEYNVRYIAINDSVDTPFLRSDPFGFKSQKSVQKRTPRFSTGCCCFGARGGTHRQFHRLQLAAQPLRCSSRMSCRRHAISPLGPFRVQVSKISAKKEHPVSQRDAAILVREEGLEPSWTFSHPQEPESCASANFATLASRLP